MTWSQRSASGGCRSSATAPASGPSRRQRRRRGHADRRRTRPPGLYNVVDDDPAPVSEWLPYLAGTIGARSPWRVPVWLGRLLAGDSVVSMMTQIRGSSNARARRELGWDSALRQLA